MIEVRSYETATGELVKVYAYRGRETRPVNLPSPDVCEVIATVREYQNGSREADCNVKLPDWPYLKRGPATRQDWRPAYVHLDSMLDRIFRELRARGFTVAHVRRAD